MSRFTKLEKDEANDVVVGTSLKGYLFNVTYAELINTFGEPTYTPKNSGDGKVMFEWVFDYKGDIFTIYDWKTYSIEYTINQLTQWNIGGKKYCGDFSDFVEGMIQRKKQKA